MQNDSVLNARLKVCSDGKDVIAGGSMFQTLTAATGKARSPMVLCNDRGSHHHHHHHHHLFFRRKNIPRIATIQVAD